MPLLPRWLFVLIGLLYFIAVRVDVMDVDASQYAEISRELSHSSNWLEIYDRGFDYLDKPPFLFWASAFSMKVFGPTSFAYKLPSILLAFLAIYATYRLTRVYYGERTARLAACILASCQGFFLWTNDVRTDMALTGWVSTALWCIAEGSEGKRRLRWVIGGTAAIALGMMTKGPIALMVPLFAFGAHWVMRREWKKILAPHHLVDMLLIGLFLVPMCIGLYTQYDLHPEKVMYGKTGTSGLRFFFWTQSFGRITGENTWDNGAPPEFLLSSMLWAFLPWILLFLTALSLAVRTIIRQRFRIRPDQEWVSTGGFLLTYAALASSHYQLPHYILVAFPFAAMRTAALLSEFAEGQHPRLFRIATPVHIVIGVLLLLTAGILLAVFPAGPGWIAFWVLCVVALLLPLLRRKNSFRVLWVPLAAITSANVIVNGHFYPSLLQYQIGSRAGKSIAGLAPQTPVAAYGLADPLNSLHFYARRVIHITPDPLPPLSSHAVYLTDSAGRQAMNTLAMPYAVIDSGRFFKVTELTLPFLNPATRSSVTTPWFLFRMIP